MAPQKLEATARTEFGKGAARKLRRADRGPAVIYGPGLDPIHISFEGQDAFLVFREAGVIVEVSVDGGAPLLVTPKQTQRDPITGFLEHIDLVPVKAE